MKRSHNQQIGRGYADPNQNSPAGRFRKFTKVDKHAQRLCELFEHPQHELREFMWNEAPAREQSFKEINHERGTFSEPGQKNDPENYGRHQDQTGQSDPVERNLEGKWWPEPEQVDGKHERDGGHVVNPFDQDRYE